MKSVLIILLLNIILVLNALGQCTGTQLTVLNPSFEGTPATPHVTPPSWDICLPGCTPDTQPGCWGVGLAPSNGSSYIGLVTAPSIPWQEGASQTLSSPMVAGTTYNFTLDLATTILPDASTGILPGCVELQIFGNMGGNSGCDQTELLWSSGDIFDVAHQDQWVTTNITFTPTANYGHLLFLVHSLGCTDGPYVMIDNLSPISPVVDVPAFTWTNVCLGNAMSFTDASTSTDGTINGWTWSFGDATPNSTVQSPPAHTYATAGTYNVTLTVTSTVPCTTTVTHAVTVYPNPVIAVNPAAASICLGGSTLLTASGASTYSWTPAAGLSATTGTSVTANPVATTTYTVTGVDANLCSGSTTVTVGVIPVPAPTVTIVNASCGLNNGTATANPAGLTYLWNTTATTQTLSNLGAGTYTVTVTGGGCSGTASGTVVNVPGGLATAVSTDEHCGHSDGTATANMTGAASYLWSNTNTTQTITGLTAGVYTVTVTSGTGCTATQSVTINNVAGPSAPFGTIVQETCSACNGSIVIAPINGALPYSFLWSNTQTVPSISGLCNGTYTVTVTDANNCIATNTTNITDTPGPTVQANMVSAENCGQSDGQGTVVVNGGVLPYGFLWSNAQTTQNLTNVIGGNYSVVVTDANSCTASSNVTINVVGGPVATLQTTNALCGQPTGTVGVSVVGGSGIYTYIWTNGQTTNSISNLISGSYCVTVNDGNCSTSDCATVVNIPGPNAEFTVSPTIMSIEQANCAITDQSTGASTWSWNFGDGSTGSIQNPTHTYETTGNYLISLTVTDANGCKDSITQTVIVKGVYLFYIPNSFTPNGDGINDFFIPTGLNVDMGSFEMYIYDRWGKLMYSTKNISKPWNGTLNNLGKVDQVVLGVYVYKILTKDIVDGKKHEYNGKITIVQ